MDDFVLRILRSYPQIYLACHVDHVRRKSTAHALSSRDSSILAHLSEREGMTARALAAHLGIQPSTLSAALARLTELGYVAQSPGEDDRRRKSLTLTRKGEIAMAATSVLDPRRVKRLLDSLDDEERRRAVDGLALLADAARRHAKKARSR
jgi:DNA-binding MarR family transcriptional regulator